MEILKSGLKSVLGAQQDAQQPTVADTVDNLVARVMTSVHLDDRRDACRALKSLAKKFRVTVGAHAMEAFLMVLEQDQADNEIISYVLEAICYIISGVPEEEEDGNTNSEDDENLGFQFTEIFIKKPENVALLLTLLEESEFKVRWPVVRLLTALLVHKPKELQKSILVSRMGVSKLMDILSDNREMIRNATLLLLAHLTKENTNIQKIVAYENAFDKLLSIIRVEGYSDGGVIVEDCLRVLLTLLKNNSSNQTLFKEGSHIQHLEPFFNIQESSELGWSPQKVTNIHMMFLFLRILVSPDNPSQVTLSSQNEMAKCGLFQQLCNILMAVGIPSDALTETINTVAEILRGNQTNQEYFSQIVAPTTPPRSAVIILLMSMGNEKQPFSLRCAILYCFQCFLYKNESCQSQMVQTLLPSKTDVNSITAGQILCGGLFKDDEVSNWLSAVALSHMLVNSQMQKEELLRVQLATLTGAAPVLLMKQLSIMLQGVERLHTRLGVLMLMCMWLANCPNAVTHFLSIDTNIPFLTALVGLAEHNESEDIVQGICAFLLGICIEFNDNRADEQTVPHASREDLCQLVVKRIGLETFLSKLNSLSKNEYYSRAIQNPHLKFQDQKEMLFDYEFCRLFKSLEGAIIKAVQPKTSLSNGTDSAMSQAQHEHSQQYISMIRDQDAEIQKLKTELHNVTSEYENTKALLADSTGTVQQLKDQNALLKAQKAVSAGTLDTQLKEELEKSRSKLQLLSDEIAELQRRKEELNIEVENQRISIIAAGTEAEMGNAAYRGQNSTQPDVVQQDGIHEAVLKETVEKLQQEVEAQRKVIAEKDQIIAQRKECSSSQKDVQVDSYAEEVNHLNVTIRDLQAEIELLKKRDQEPTVPKELHDQLVKEKEKAEEDLEILTREQEDLLILFTEQGDKMTEYKDRLIELGQQVEEELEEDDIGELEDDCDDIEAEMDFKSNGSLENDLKLS